MEKQDLVRAFQGASVGDTVTIQFVGAAASLSGSYKFVGTRAGRGRGGSTIVDLLDGAGNPLGKVPNPSASDPAHLSDFGSGVSHLVGTIKVGAGDVAGDASKAALDLVPKDTLRASRLTEALRALVGQTGVKIQMQSIDGDLNGEFTLVTCEAARGRVPQLLLKLRRADGSEVDFYTYRHASLMVDVAI